MIVGTVGASGSASSGGGASSSETDLVISGPIEVCVDNAGALSVWYVREERTYDNQTGASAATTKWSADGATWSATVPAGTKKVGGCSSAGVVFSTGALVCYNNAGTLTSVYVRSKLLIDSAGTLTTAAPEYSSNGATWTTTAPAGTATPGACGTPNLAFSAAALVCVTDGPAATQQYIRQVATLDNAGAVTATVTEFSVDAVTWTATAPVGTITAGPCGSSAATYSASSLICVNDGVTSTPFLVRHAVLNGVTTAEYSSDGSTFTTTLPAGTITLGECVSASNRVYSVPALVCYDDGVTKTQVFVRESALGALVTTEYSTDGVIWDLTVPTGTGTPGACPAVPGSTSLYAAPYIGCLDDGASQSSIYVRDLRTITATGVVTFLTEYSSDLLVWSNIAPTGTISPGPCTIAVEWFGPTSLCVTPAVGPPQQWFVRTTTTTPISVEYSSDGGVTWAATPPVGTVVAGECQSVELVLGSAVPMCVDVAGTFTQWYSRSRLMVQPGGATWTETIEYSTLGSSWSTVAPTGIAVPGLCSQATTEVVYTPANILCADNAGVRTTVYVRQRQVLTAAGAVASTVTEYSTDGAVWTGTVPAGTITVGSCLVDVDTAYSASAEVCFDNAGVKTTAMVRQRLNLDLVANTIASTTTEYSVDGENWSTTALPGTVTAGRCIPASGTVQQRCVETVPDGIHRLTYILDANGQTVSVLDGQTVLGGTPDGPPLVLDLAFWKTAYPATSLFTDIDCLVQSGVSIAESDFCVEEPAGIFSPWKRRSFGIVDTKTGGLSASVPVIEEWSSGGLIWTGTAPIGTIRPGLCPQTSTVVYPSSNLVCIETPVGVYTQWFIRSVETPNPGAGSVETTQYSLTGAAGSWSATIPTGVIVPGLCPITIEASYCVAGVQMVRRSRGATVSWSDAAGTPTAPTALQIAAATAGSCTDLEAVPESDYCVENPVGTFTVFKRRETRLGAVTTVEWSSNGTAWSATTPVGAVRAGACANGNSYQEVPFCINGAQVLRRTRTDAAGVVTVTWVNPAGVAQTPTAPQIAAGIEGDCEVSAVYANSEKVCVTNAGVQVGWLIRQRQTLTLAGAVAATVTEYSLDGVTYTTTAPVGVITLGDCGCCPIPAGDVCWTVGVVSGRAIAIYNPSTLITTYIDKAGGGVIAAANVVACDRPLAAHIFDAVPGAPWTPAVGVPAGGTLVGVSMSVVSGTATLIDADGTTLAGLPTGYSTQWDSGAPTAVTTTFTAPQSITAAAGSRTIVSMLVRM